MFALTALLASCVTLTQDAADARAQDGPIRQGVAVFDREAPPAVEAVRVKTGHVLVKPVINGHRAGWFIFDTGAGICCVSTPYLDELGLVLEGDLPSVGVGGPEKTKLFRAKELALGPVKLSEHPFLAVDLTFLKAHLAEEICGVIGYGLLSRCVVEFDMVAPRIALHDPATFDAKGTAWGELELLERIPAVRVRFEEHEGLFRLDTGANSAITFNDPAVRKWKLLEGRDVRASKLGGVGGFIAAKSGSLAFVELGGQRQEHVSADFALESKGSHAGDATDGSIGAALLRPYVLVLDYTHERIAYRPRVGAAK